MVISIEGGPTCEEMDLAKTKPAKSKPNTDTRNGTNTENPNINFEDDDEFDQMCQDMDWEDMERNCQENINILEESTNEAPETEEPLNVKIAKAMEKMEKFNSYLIGVSAIHPEYDPCHWPAPLGDNIYKPKENVLRQSFIDYKEDSKELLDYYKRQINRYMLHQCRFGYCKDKGLSLIHI